MCPRAVNVSADPPVLAADAAAVAEICDHAARCGRVALDTEADSFHSYRSKLCLIQLSFCGRNAVIDPLGVTIRELEPLAALLADPSIPVFVHGADYDVRILDRDLGVRVTGIRDTQAAALLLGEEQTGLAALLGTYLGTVLDKRFQRADWGARPLSRELLCYAVNDTAHLESLAELLEARLRALGRLAWWVEECQALETVCWEAPAPDPLAFERIKGASSLAGDPRDRLAALFRWREDVAAARDVAPFRIVRNEVLLEVAKAGPNTLSDLGEIAGVGPGVARRWGREMLDVMREVSPAPARVVRPRMPVDRAREERVRSLRDARDHRAKELCVAPGVLAPRSALESVVDHPPEGEEDLKDLLQRRWRAEVLAAVLLPIVAGWKNDGKNAGGTIS